MQIEAAKQKLDYLYEVIKQVGGLFLELFGASANGLSVNISV